MKKYFCVLIAIFGVISCSKVDIPSRKALDYDDTSSFVFMTTEEDTSHVVSNMAGESHEVIQYNPFPKTDLIRPIVRIPSMVMTKNHTILVACENRQINADKGEIDILVARKEDHSDIFEIRNVFKFNEEQGRSMNPTFTVDDTGRVYLFTCHLKDMDNYAVNQTTEDVDFVYKYSDDDGKTWSGEYSLKGCWDTSNYTAVIPSPAAGITLNDGTMLLPTMIVKDRSWHSGMLSYKKKKWLFSNPLDTEQGDNECTVYVDNRKQILLDSRTYGQERHRYVYNLKHGKLAKNGFFSRHTNVVVQAHIVKDEIENVYWMGNPDSQENIRENASLFISSDGIQWYKSSGLMEGACNGYSAIACDNEHLFVCFETVGGALLQDLSGVKKCLVSHFYKEHNGS